MPLRDLEYMVRRWRALVTSTQPTPKKLPLIIPIVVAPAEPRWRAPVLGILSYHVAVSPEEMPPSVRAAIKVSPELEETYVTLAERLEQKGFEQGMAKGVEQGIAEGFEQGRAKTLEQLVTLKFGPPSAEVLARVAALDRAGLDRAVARIPSASSIEELFDAR